MNGLKTRFFMGGWYLCDGKAPEGKENDGEIYIGNAIKWFETFEEAEKTKQIIDTAYGKEAEE